ncbi:MAG: hypothetical protein ACRC1L_12320 [Prochlorococcaceae cyanobacterium]
MALLEPIVMRSVQGARPCTASGVSITASSGEASNTYKDLPMVGV